MENTVQAWVKELKQALGNNLVSVILYGCVVNTSAVVCRTNLTSWIPCNTTGQRRFFATVPMLLDKDHSVAQELITSNA